MKNLTMLQYFEWYLPNDANHWNRAAMDAEALAKIGITDVWLPPAYKGFSGINDVGYGVYDMYDLGEFDQKGTVPTKYGTKDEYIAAINAFHENGIRVLGDIVMNHRMGADYSEILKADSCAHWNRSVTLAEDQTIQAWTGFNFPGRNGKYSDFCWNHTHFDGVDWDDRTKKNGFFRFDGHCWDNRVDSENGNYDYLMGADLDFSNPAVVEEMLNWSRWYFETTGIDGVRLDAVKHISSDFFRHWLMTMRNILGRDFFAVGEYWNRDVNILTDYISNCGNMMQLFDVPLHYNFERASHAGSSFDLRTIFDNTLVSRNPWLSVTFVDNHDSQPGQALESWVQGWFRELAYALILLRRDGIPCVFYGDLKGIPNNCIPPMGTALEKMISIRSTFAYGDQIDYFDYPNVIGWTRASGLAVVMSNGDYGWKHMRLGHPGQVFVDALGHRGEEIVIGDDGWADFTANGRSVSVWVPKI